MAFPPYADIAGVDEDTRISIIGVAAQTKIVGVYVDDKPPEKAKRYVKKVLARFPLVQHIDTGPGLVKGTVLLRFGPRPAKGDLH